MKKNNKAFTLVELIVVITILAILGTIAFINLQGYSVSARDGKRISDINNIIKKIGIETVKGTSISSLINQTKTNSGLTIDGNSGSSIQGTANFANLKEDGSKFKDPVTNDDYVFSYSIGGSGTGAYKFTQVSTVNEEENTAVVKGNYYLMQPSDSPSITYNPDNTYFVVDGGVDLPYEIDNSSSSNNISYECNGLIGSANPDQWGSNNGFPDFNLCNNTIVLSSLNNISLSQNLTNNPGARDVYAFVLEAGKTYDLESLGDNDNSDTAFFLYDNQGNKLAINDDIDDSIYRSLITYTANYTGYYFLGVMGYDDGGTYDDYTLDISVSNNSPIASACGLDANKHLYTTPTRLCDSGIASSVTDNGILGDYTWTCGETACSGRHAFAWNYNPADIRDMFGNRSIYTENWNSNTCDPSSMSIVDLNPGTNVIPTTLADNTIYRLSAGDYIQNSTINLGTYHLTSVVLSNCSGLIGTGNVTFYTGDRVDDTFLLANNSIITGIKFDGINNGIGGAHASGLTSWPWTNKNALFVKGNPAENITLNNLDIFNFVGTFDIYGYSTLNKLNIYNNGIGLDVRYAWNSVFTNINSYNNSGYGIYTDGISGVFSNIKSFNNGDGGVLRYDENVSYNNILSFNNTNGIRYVSFGLLNNIYSYNNTGYGFKIDGEYTDINNIYSYNNNIGLESTIIPNNAYLYGNTKLYGNTSSNFTGDTIPFGTNSTLGFTDGTSIDSTGTFSSSWVVQPSTVGWNINTKGKQSLTFTSGTTYIYGSNIGNQTQPIRYDPVTNIPELWGVDGVHYDSTKKVGEW